LCAVKRASPNPEGLGLAILHDECFGQADQATTIGAGTRIGLLLVASKETEQVFEAAMIDAHVILQQYPP
jgi:hypothetical protein